MKRCPRKIVKERNNDGLSVTLELSCGHETGYPLWRHIKGPAFRPKRIDCQVCAKVPRGNS